MKKKRKLGRKLLSFVLTLVMVLNTFTGIVPGMSLTAHAATETYTKLMNDHTVVKFNGYNWYIIEDNSESETSGTVTLLAAGTDFGTMAFKSDYSSNSYNSSDVKGYLDKIVEGTAGEGKPDFKDVASAIKPVSLTTYVYQSTTDVSETTENAKLYLLSTSEAANTEFIKTLGFEGAQLYKGWWLRSPGNKDENAAIVHGEYSRVVAAGARGDRALGVRPALKLDLSKVTFDSGTNTFTMGSAANDIIINSAEHGFVTANPASAAAGTTVTLTAQSAEGYKLKNISASYMGIVPDRFSYQEYVENYSGTQFDLYSSYPDFAWRLGYDTTNKISVTSKSDTSKIDRVVLEANARIGIAGTIKADVGTVTRNGNTITVSDIDNTTVTIYSEHNGYSCFDSAEVYGKTADYVELTLTGTDNPNVFTFTMPDSAVSVSAEFEVAYTALTDENKPTITVSNDHNPPQIGDTLTAATTATDITYSWHYSDSDTPLGTASTYTVKKEDFGKQIVVTATQNKDNNGDITGVKPTQTSEATTAVVKKTPATIDTNTAKTNAGISFSDEKATPTAGYEISTDGQNPATLTEGSLSLTNILDKEGTQTIYVRTAATDDTAAGAWVEVALPARSDAPTNLTTENATNGSSENGKIKGTSENMEYKLKDSTDDWKRASATETTVKAGIYLVRTKATDTSFAGKTAEVTVKSNYTKLENTAPTITITKAGGNNEPDKTEIPQIDDTLTANTDPAGATPVIYQWYRDGEPISDATGKTYTLTAGDADKTITVKASQPANADGNGSAAVETNVSNPTSAVELKSPAALDENTAKTEGITISYDNETIAPNSGYEVSSTNEGNGENITSLTEILDGEGTPTIYVRRKKSDDTAAGQWVAITLPTRPVAPTDLTTNNADNGTSSNGTINGVKDTMEYSSKGGDTWTQATGTTIDNLNPGVYLVRTKATADAPAGKTTEVKVGSKENILTDKQKPEAKADLVYTGDKQALINAPAEKLPEWADKLQYALGTDETTKPEASAYTDDIPTGANSGTYYVWYRVYVDDNNASDPTLVTVEISPVDKAELNKAIKEAEDYYNTIKDNPAYSEQAKALSDAIKTAKALADNKNAKDTEVSTGITAINEAKKKAEAGVKDVDDTAAAKKVIDAINVLPASDKVATTDKAAIEAARKAYDGLTADQKKKVPADVLKKLADAETALKAAEKDAADKTAADKVIEAINKLPSSDKVATTDKAAIEAARKAYDALSADQKKKVPADVLKKLTDAEAALKAAEAAEKAAKELEAAKKEAQAAMNEQVTVKQKGKKFTVKWKKSTSADGYYVYASYCGKKATKPAKTVKKNTTTKVTISKINGKKISTKKNFHVYVVPYKIIDGKKVKLGKSTVAHLVGAKSTKYSNVKKLTLTKKKYTVKVGKTAKIKAKITLVNKNKKHIPKGHGAKFRYKSSDTSIATVDKNGKVKGIRKGTCTIYVYSINGLVKKAKVTVK